jgi:hypothetical protein
LKKGVPPLCREKDRIVKIEDCRGACGPKTPKEQTRVDRRDLSMNQDEVGPPHLFDVSKAAP